MALNKRGGGYSMILSLSLLLVVCIVILECEAAPGTVVLDGTKAREPPEEEKLAELDLMTGQGMGNSRSKRALPTSSAGIDPKKLAVNTSASSPDGRLCMNGEDIFTDTEGVIWKKILLGALGVVGDGRWMSYDGGTQLANQFSGGCASNKCAYDPKTGSFICGKAIEGIFPDGKVCHDGSDPPTGAKYIEILDHDKANRQYTESYGKWCVTGKCVAFLIKSGQPTIPICGGPPKRDSSSVGSRTFQPILLLLVMLFSLCALPTLQ